MCNMQVRSRKLHDCCTALGLEKLFKSGCHRVDHAIAQYARRNTRLRATTTCSSAYSTLLIDATKLCPLDGLCWSDAGFIAHHREIPATVRRTGAPLLRTARQRSVGSKRASPRAVHRTRQALPSGSSSAVLWGMCAAATMPSRGTRQQFDPVGTDGDARTGRAYGDDVAAICEAAEDTIPTNAAAN